MSVVLQLFLGLNLFLIGALATIAAQHALAHFRPRPHETEKPPHPPAQSAPLPPAVKERLLQTAQANYQAVLDHAATALHHDLQDSSDQLNKLLNKLGAEVVGTEMERYRIDLEQLRKQAETVLGGAQ